MSNQRKISVDTNCYDLTKFGRQKAMADSKYGHPIFETGLVPAYIPTAIDRDE